MKLFEFLVNFYDCEDTSGRFYQIFEILLCAALFIPAESCYTGTIHNISAGGFDTHAKIHPRP